MKKIFLNEKVKSIMTIIDLVWIAAIILCIFGFYESIMRAIVVALLAIEAIFSGIALWQLKNWNTDNFKSEKKMLLNYYKAGILIDAGIFLSFAKQYFPLEQIWNIAIISVAVLFGIIGLIYLTRYYKLSKTI